MSCSPLIISIALALIYVADRSNFWLKKHKQFNPWSFGALCVLLSSASLATVNRGDKDIGLLKRIQTDE